MTTTILTRDGIRKLLSGNEATARAALEVGVRTAAGYPGTPSTEILESLALNEGIDIRWLPMELNLRALAAGLQPAGGVSGS